MTDTTRKDMVGCYGNKKMFTPNLDALGGKCKDYWTKTDGQWH